MSCFCCFKKRSNIKESDNSTEGLLEEPEDSISSLLPKEPKFPDLKDYYSEELLQKFKKYKKKEYGRFENFPEELLIVIFSNLNFQDLIGAISLVCKMFFVGSHSELLWKNIFEKTFGSLPLPNGFHSSLFKWRRGFLEFIRMRIPNNLTWRENIYHLHQQLTIEIPESNHIIESALQNHPLINSATILNPFGCILYYEITIINLPPNQRISVGICDIMKPSFSQYSISFSGISNSGNFHIGPGILLRNSAFTSFSFQQGDTVGIGLDQSLGILFFTKNGIRTTGAIGNLYGQFLAAVELTSPGQIVKFNFGLSGFYWNPIGEKL